MERKFSRGQTDRRERIQRLTWKYKYVIYTPSSKIAVPLEMINNPFHLSGFIVPMPEPATAAESVLKGSTKNEPGGALTLW